jgi:hypothetical protein
MANSEDYTGEGIESVTQRIIDAFAAGFRDRNQDESETMIRRRDAQYNLVPKKGLELEPVCGRERSGSPQAKS